MKAIIAGSRGINDIEVLRQAIKESGFQVDEVVSGTARGVDRLGERWAEENGKPVTKFPADWEKYGKKAGYLRNKEMAEYGDALIALWDGESRGTASMIKLARDAGLSVHVTIIKDGDEEDMTWALRI